MKETPTTNGLLIKIIEYKIIWSIWKQTGNEDILLIPFTTREGILNIQFTNKVFFNQRLVGKY